MDQEQSSKKIVKYTLEAVFSAQERLRKHLDQLIKENRPIKDENERDRFFRELTYSTLGLGAVETEFMTPGSGRMFYVLNLDGFVREFTYYNDKIVSKEYIGNDHANTKSTDNNTSLPISEMWNLIKMHLFAIFPKAIDRATSISKETSDKGKSTGYKVE